MKRLAFLLSASVVLIIGCGPSNSALLGMEALNNELVSKSKSEVPSVKELHALFPYAAVKLYSTRLKKGTTSIQATDIIFDRYLLTMNVNVEVDVKVPTITSYGDPSITLNEVTAVVSLADGRIEISYGNQLRISPEQWRKIVAAGGQFPVAGIDLNTNRPIDNIAALKSHVRTTGIN